MIHVDLELAEVRLIMQGLTTLHEGELLDDAERERSAMLAYKLGTASLDLLSEMLAGGES